MADFTFDDGVATIVNPDLYETWPEREDYVAALTVATTPQDKARKRLVMDFEVALARIVRAGTVDRDIDGVLERFIDDGYIQHDPNIAEGRAGLAGFFRAGAFGTTPAPPIALTVEGELVSVMLTLALPDPTAPGSTYDFYILTTFRVRDGKLVEHWGAREKEA